MEIVAQDTIVVKAEVGGEVPGFKQFQVFSIVSGFGVACGGSEKDHTQGVLSGISFWVRIHMKLSD